MRPEISKLVERIRQSARHKPLHHPPIGPTGRQREEETAPLVASPYESPMHPIGEYRSYCPCADCMRTGAEPKALS